MADDAARDFDALARRYWQAWGDALRQGAGATGVPGWNEALQWWGGLAQGGSAQADEAVRRASAQAQPWFGQMQQLAARFAGVDANAAQIAKEWKRLLGANPLPEMLRAMRAPGQQGVEAWFEQVEPWLDAWRREADRWLRLPAFGLTREHQERWQALLRAQFDYRGREEAFNRLLLRAGERAYALFEQKLAAHAAPGKQLGSARALFDLWIDAAEEAYAEVALSEDFRHAWGALVNAQMRLRAGVQKEVELASGLFGMPTRTEMDAAHRKIAELERELRRMRSKPEATAASPRKPAPTGGKAEGKVASPAKKPAGRTKASAAKPAARKPAKGAPR